MNEIEVTSNPAKLYKPKSRVGEVGIGAVLQQKLTCNWK